MPISSTQQIKHLVKTGRIEEAKCLAERMTIRNPADAHGWLLLGSVLMTLDRPVMAAEKLRKARALNPGNRVISDQLCQSLIQAGLRLETMAQYENAEAIYREAIAIAPNAVPAHLNLGRMLSAAGLYEQARQELHTVLQLQPQQPDACAALALSYQFEGDYEKAMDILRGPLQKRPVAPPIAVTYAVLARHFSEEVKAITLLEGLLRTSLPVSAARDSHFALGKLYDAAEDYDRAFEHYRLGNRLLNYHYNRAETKAMFRAITEAFSKQHHLGFARSGNESSLPVFIIGMPRSGTTLVEQILASHPKVFGAGEQDDIARIVHGLGGPAPKVEAVQRLTKPVLEQAAQGYLDTLSQLAPNAKRITDKMPHNFLALGYIDLLFPGCRIIHCVRDPRDTCLSIWFQQMAESHPYTNDLDALADYYRHYQALMAHWKSVIRVPMHEVCYEDLVGDVERGARELIGFCGLEWSERCLRFYENERVISTPTYDDVRRPVHDRSVGRWRNYEDHLSAFDDLFGNSA